MKRRSFVRSFALFFGSFFFGSAWLACYRDGDPHLPPVEPDYPAHPSQPAKPGAKIGDAGPREGAR